MDLALVAHELGGALTPTRNSLQLLQAREGTDPEQQRLLDIAHRGLERANRILDNIATVASLDGRAGEPENVELQPALQRLVDDFESEARNRAIAVRVHVDSDVREIPIETFAFEQVISNLLSNALKFTGPEGRVRVLASRARGPVLPGRMLLLAGGFGFRPAFVQVQVADTGVGISAETRRRLFRPFYRGEEAAETPGMGLGLTVCQRLVQRLRGDLRVDAPKKGASIVLTLPANRRTFELVDSVDRVREELQSELADDALVVAILRRRSGAEIEPSRLELTLHEHLDNAAARVAALSDSLFVVWTRAGVRPLVRSLSRSIRQELGTQADRDYEISVRRASKGTLGDPLLLQTAVRCHHSLATVARKREVIHVENPRRGR